MEGVDVHAKAAVAKLIDANVRVVADFPKPGVMFRDISTLLLNPDAFRAVVNLLADRYRSIGVDYVAGVESRGFIFAAAVAAVAGLPMIILRKKGKLPGATASVAYKLEYGTAELECHVDAFPAGKRVAVIDDLLATGGTMAASAALIEQLGGQVASLDCVIELTGLRGRENLAQRFRAPVFTIAAFD